MNEQAHDQRVGPMTNDETIEQSEGELVTLTSVVEYSKTAAALVELRERFEGAIYDVSTKVGKQDATSARAELRTYRTDLEKLRVKIKSPALAHIQLIDSEARRITALLRELETPIDDQLKAEARREAEELQEKIDAEKARVAAEEAARKAAEQAELDAKQEAIRVEQERLKEQERILEARERQRQEDAAKEDQERRAKFQREQREERARVDDQRRAEERERREKFDAERKENEQRLQEESAKNREEDRRIREDRERVDAERRKVEDEQRAIRKAQEDRDRASREQAEQIEATKRRKAMVITDARDALKVFVVTFGTVPEFKTVARYIKKFLDSKASK